MSSSHDEHESHKQQEQQNQNITSESIKHRENLTSFLLETLQQKKGTSSEKIYDVLQNYSINTLSSILNLLMFQSIENDLENTESNLPDNFMDTLDRVPRKLLKLDDICPICKVSFLDDKYPFVVQLRCGHKFDECIGLWLKINATCPVCRRSVLKERSAVPQEDEYNDMYS
ncbi:hypothetical protein PCK1_001405 [Pneumocystis canis]|nr:hypothetical protein PCK1_001405 [Pneumocystis canis]